MSSQRREATARRRKGDGNSARKISGTKSDPPSSGVKGSDLHTATAQALEHDSVPPAVQHPRSYSIPPAAQQHLKSGSVPPVSNPISKELHVSVKNGAKVTTPLLPNGMPRNPKRKREGPVTWFRRSVEEPLLVYRTDLNVLWWLVMGVAFLVRFWRLDYPCYVVFDEVHFGKFASYYLQRSFFFDVHPPLGKMLFALVGYLSGFDGLYLFPSIGSEYPPAVPYVVMRGLSAMTGSLLVACVYQIMMELGFSHSFASLAALFTAFDNSLVLQSRVIMLDSLLILFTYSSILAYLKFYRHRPHPFSPAWHCSLALTGVSLGCLLGIKYTGLLGMLCVGVLTLCDLWQLIGDHSLTMLTLVKHTVLRGMYLLGIPVLLNVVLFYLHFLLLTQAGPGNAFVSQAFRNSLEGTVDLSPTVELSPNATLLRYGSTFSLRSAELSCWLHSHNHTYPLKYDDGRGSSFQQQVTCYDFRDINNYWAIRKPGSPESPAIPDDHSPVKNGDKVELLHLGTNRLLNSHDVAAPLSPALQEVAGYINYSAQFTPYLQWQLEVGGLKPKEMVFWEKGKLKLRLLHTHSKQALSCSGKRLPEWGFQQLEVVTDRAIQGPHVIWGVEDLSPPNITHNQTQEEEEQQIKESLTRRVHRSQVGGGGGGATMSFWEKYWELQENMAYAHSNLGDHTFGAPPQNWPLMGKTLPYWLDETSNAQVTLLGNPVLWWASTGAVHVFFLLSTLYLMRQRRKHFDIGEAEFRQWWTSGCVLIVGWLVHYAPYFLLSRVLFLHHYLPALPFKFMLLAAVCQHVHAWAQRWSSLSHLVLPTFYVFIAFLLVAIVTSYLIFAPFTYGYPALSLEQISWRVWVDTWDLLHR